MSAIPETQVASDMKHKGKMKNIPAKSSKLIKKGGLKPLFTLVCTSHILLSKYTPEGLQNESTRTVKFHHVDMNMIAVNMIIEFACKQLPACLLTGNSARDNFLGTFGAWLGHWKQKLDAADANKLQKRSKCTCSFFKVDYQVSISHVFFSPPRTLLTVTAA